MGIHGEPGIARETLRPADVVTDELLDTILADTHIASGARVAVLINSLGSTPLMELYIIMRRVKVRLDAAALSFTPRWSANYCTSLEMAGASVTLMHLG
jgi:dihydroxyacetone kinase-like protein